MTLRRYLQTRFGDVPAALDRRIAAANQAQLDALADRIFAAASLDTIAEPESEPPA